MENKYKIILSYIQDLSVEIPSPESLITIRNTTPEYRMSVDISTKPAIRKMLEVLTTLTYANPNKKKAQGYFQILNFLYGRHVWVPILIPIIQCYSTNHLQLNMQVFFHQEKIKSIGLILETTLILKIIIVNI